MILVDDHLLLRVLVGVAPQDLTGESIATTTGWWWRALSPLATARSVGGQHSRFAEALSPPEAQALWETLCMVGRPGSLISMPELVELGPAMAWLARNDGLNRLTAEAIAVAMDRSATIWVRTGNEGRLVEMSTRYGIEVVVV